MGVGHSLHLVQLDAHSDCGVAGGMLPHQEAHGKIQRASRKYDSAEDERHFLATGRDKRYCLSRAMNEIDKLIQLANEDHNTNKKPARFFWWLFKVQWIVVRLNLFRQENTEMCQLA